MFSLVVRAAATPHPARLKIFSFISLEILYIKRDIKSSGNFQGVSMKIRKKENNFFSEQLRKIMFEKNLNQQDVAGNVGVAQSVVSNWLKGAKNPSLSSVKNLSKFFNVPMSYFIGNIKEEDTGTFEDKDTKIIKLLEENIKIGKEILKEIKNLKK